MPQEHMRLAGTGFLHPADCPKCSEETILTFYEISSRLWAMARFFTDWATWLKLVFILGCAIVVTVCLGIAKLAHMHFKLRKYSAIAEQEKQEQAMARQANQRRAQEDVPFGIRAIEGGIQVEGVWISRGNTPEPPSSRDTSTLSAWDRVPRKDYSVDLESQLNTHRWSRSNSSAGTARREGTTATIAHPDSVHRSASSRDPSPNTPDIRAANAKHYPPLSYAKYNGNPALARSSTSATSLERIETIRRASGSVLPGQEVEDGMEMEVSADVSSTAAASQDPLNHRRQARQQSTDLDLMHSHRMSQAAETGQLTPRARRPGASDDWVSMVNDKLNLAGLDTGEHYERRRARSSSPVSSKSSTNHAMPSSDGFPTPAWIDSLPASARRSSLPDVTPFAKFCQTAPTLQTPKRPASAGSNQPAIQAVGHSLKEHSTTMRATGDRPGQLEASISIPDHSQLAANIGQQDTRGIVPERRRSSFGTRETAVVRGHGTGFEILKPGTFSQPSQPAEGKRSARPPISLHNSSRPRSSSNESRRKLQKKRRPSSESQSSVSAGADRETA